MSNKADTNPNFPAPPPNGDPEVDSLLDGLRRPIVLDVKKTSAESSGQDAAEFQASARVPPARIDHETNPDARVIVETTPVPPVAEALVVSPEERARMDAMFAAATSPPARKSDPPAVQTEPPAIPTARLGWLPKASFAALAVGLVVLVLWFATTHDTQPKVEASPSATTTTTASAPVTLTSAVVPVPVETAPAPSALPSASAPAPRPTPTAPRLRPHSDAGPSSDDDDPGARLIQGH